MATGVSFGGLHSAYRPHTAINTHKLNADAQMSRRTRPLDWDRLENLWNLCILSWYMITKTNFLSSKNYKKKVLTQIT
jgi:hypothetical protein